MSPTWHGLRIALTPAYCGTLACKGKETLERSTAAALFWLQKLWGNRDLAVTRSFLSASRASKRCQFVSALRQIDANGIVLAVAFIVFAKSVTQSRGLHAHEGVDVGVKPCWDDRRPPERGCSPSGAR